MGLKNVHFIKRNFDRDFDPNVLPIDPSKSIPGSFYHGIILNSNYGWYAAINISDSKMLHTPNYIAYWDHNFAASHKSVRDVNTKELNDGDEVTGGFTPTYLHYVYAANCIRYGLTLKIGSNKLNKIQEKDIIDRNKVEMKFELERRRIAPNAPSRLESLFIADNRNVIRRMFNNNPDLIILKVKITEALRFIKVDSAWYDRYWEYKHKKYIKNYWRSKPFKENTDSWEYLVDGLLVVDDPEGLKYIRSRKDEIDQENANFKH